MKCPLCEDYFEAGKVKFEKLRISSKNSFEQDSYIRVCPGCYKKNFGVMIK